MIGCPCDPEVIPAAVFSLNAHATYRCRHSGACCTAGWTIPVEPQLQSRVGTDWLVPRADGACPQYEHHTGLCHLHRTGGEALLPGSCHHFPRRALIDGRGIFIALSLYCPTAARMLLESEEPLRIQSEPPAFPAARGYEGLDASGEWPPLLRPDALFDEESFGVWEAHLVERVGNGKDSVESTLAQLAVTGERLRGWSSADGSLAEWTRTVLNAEAGADPQPAGLRYVGFGSPSAYRRVLAAVPAGLDAPTIPASFDEIDARLVAPFWNAQASLVRRYLGAKAFASWTAYQSRGLRTQIAELFLAAAVLRVECVRACARRGTPLDRRAIIEAARGADLLLVHLADRETLLTWLGKVESDAAANGRR